MFRTCSRALLSVRPLGVRDHTHRSSTISYRSICALVLIGLIASFASKHAAAGNSFKIKPKKISITINIETPAPSKLRKRWKKAIEHMWNTSEGGGPHKVCGLEVEVKVRFKTQGPKPRDGYHKTQDTRPQLGDPEKKDPLGGIWRFFHDESGNLANENRTDYQPTQHDRFANFPTPDQVGNKFDYDNVIAHEAGHFLGLSDEYKTDLKNGQCKKKSNGKWVTLLANPEKADEYEWKDEDECIVKLKPGFTGSIMAHDDSGVVKQRHLEQLVAAHDLNDDLKDCDKPLSLSETNKAWFGDVTMEGDTKIDSEFNLEGHATRRGWLTAGDGNPKIDVTGTLLITGWRRGPFFRLEMSGKKLTSNPFGRPPRSFKADFVFEGRLKNGEKIFPTKKKKGWTIDAVVKSIGANAP